MQAASPTPIEEDIPDLLVYEEEESNPDQPEVPMDTVQITMEVEDPLLQLDLDSIADRSGVSSILTSLSPDTRRWAYPLFPIITIPLKGEISSYSSSKTLWHCPLSI